MIVAGRSRSPAVVAGYLLQTLKMKPDLALAEITSKRDCSIVPELRRIVEQYATLCEV